jgi:hypothetical protein
MRNDCSIAEQLKTQLTFTGTFNESIAFSLSSLVLSTLAAEMQKSKKKTQKPCIPPYHQSVLKSIPAKLKSPPERHSPLPNLLVEANPMQLH